MPASMLDLPRELFLIVLSHLAPTDLTHLAGVTRDHYVAVQESLYARITITSWERLVKLVATSAKPLVVSNISAKQRQRWQTLDPGQLRERDIQRLDILLDATANGADKVTGVVLASLIGAISRRSNSVHITLTLQGPWSLLLSQLQKVALPDVRKLTLFIGQSSVSHPYVGEGAKLWDVCFAGSSFPDLREIECDTVHKEAAQRESTLNSASKISLRHPASRTKNSIPFQGLRKMTTIKLKYNHLLDTTVLMSLFGSGIIPKNLTRLEIANCFSLNQVRDLETLAVLLQRGLQLLQYLKLHLQRLELWGDEETKYASDIEEHPDWHLCNVVRSLGQDIKSLDLALPFACSRIFVPKAKKPQAAMRELDYPTIPKEPYETLPSRLIEAGYKYRRLICWQGVCRETHKWDEMPTLASEQEGMMSWEIVSAVDKVASWHVSNCLPVTYKSRIVIKRQLAESER